jgi:kynureninase
MTFSTDVHYARRLDEQDELAAFRERFVVDDPELVYLDGNSLGRLPKQSLDRARDVVARQWGQGLIRSWNEHWLDLPRRVGAKIARLIGAADDEVTLADSTSVNLFKLTGAALRVPRTRGRTKIVTDDLNFPTDLYILRSAAELAGADCSVHVVASPDGMTVPFAALAEAIDSTTALVALSHTAFKSAYVYDMPAVTNLAHEAGALVLWDLSHSVGAMPVSLSSAAVDLAVGCTYKYLNGGPGAPALLYVRRDLQESIRNPIAGWFGHHDQLAFHADYQPAAGIRRMLTGTPPILSLALIEPGVDLVLEAGVERLRAKSVHQTEYLIGLWECLLAPLGFALGSPREPERRGSHVALCHPEGLRIARALVDQMHVIPDFRAPDTLRFGLCPLYTTYAELHRAVSALHDVTRDGRYRCYPGRRRGVT